MDGRRLRRAGGRHLGARAPVSRRVYRGPCWRRARPAATRWPGVSTWPGRSPRSTSTSWKTPACWPAGSSGCRVAPGRARGAPAKLYRRADREIELSLPPRRYDLAAAMLADAVSRAGRAAAGSALAEAAASAASGSVGRRAGTVATPLRTPDRAILEEHGYEPRRTGTGDRDAELPVPPPGRRASGTGLRDEQGLPHRRDQGAGAGHAAARLDPSPGTAACASSGLNKPAHPGLHRARDRACLTHGTHHRAAPRRPDVRHRAPRLPRVETLAVEEPLELRIDGRPLAVTMRTPGSDMELPPASCTPRASSPAPTTSRRCVIAPAPTPTGRQTYNVLDIVLADGVAPPDPSVERAFLTTSSCGLCGAAGIEAVRRRSAYDGRRRSAAGDDRACSPGCRRRCAASSPPSTAPAACTPPGCSTRPDSCCAPRGRRPAQRGRQGARLGAVRRARAGAAGCC